MTQQKLATVCNVKQVMVRQTKRAEKLQFITKNVFRTVGEKTGVDANF